MALPYGAFILKSVPMGEACEALRIFNLPKGDPSVYLLKKLFDIRQTAFF
jgi:hypothetical protein